MTVTFDSFVSKYPQFLDLDPLLVETELANVIVETCSYSGFKTPEESDLGVELHLAHVLTTFIRSGAGATTGTQASGQLVKKLESRQDKIEYHIPNSPTAGLFDLSTTFYGQRLEKLIDNNYCGGLVC